MHAQKNFADISSGSLPAAPGVSLAVGLAFAIAVALLSAAPARAQEGPESVDEPTRSEDALSGASEVAGSLEEDLFGGGDEGSGTEEDLFGGGDEGSGTEEDLFGGNGANLVSDVVQTEQAASPESELLTSENVEIGGSFSFDVDASWRTANKGDWFDELTSPANQDLALTLGATLFLDARPDDDFRFFGKLDVAYPFTEDAERSFDDIVRITELFSDFNIADTVFLRGGKHTVSWGVGYFFSPADIINLTDIDPEDPTADVEGPVSLKANLPVDAHNFYLYVLAQDISKPYELAVAPKAEFLIETLEIGLGGFYQGQRAPTAMVTLSLPLWDFDFFGEAVIGYGADKSFVRAADVSPGNPLGLTVEEAEDKAYFSGTAGALFRFNDEADFFDFSVSGQYMYNGQGYEDPHFLTNNAAGVALLLVQNAISRDDMLWPGMHYAAGSINWAGLLTTDLTLGLFWIGNLSDGSGRVVPSLSFKPIDELEIGLSVPVTYGDSGAEYTPQGGKTALSLSVSVGKGKF